MADALFATLGQILSQVQNWIFLQNLGIIGGSKTLFDSQVDQMCLSLRVILCAIVTFASVGRPCEGGLSDWGTLQWGVH